MHDLIRASEHAIGHTGDRSVRAVSRPGTRTQHYVGAATCCHCSKPFRWRGRESASPTCPNCGAKVVILLERDGVCTVHPATRDWIDEMICDWLEDRSVEDEELEDGDFDQPVSSEHPAAA